MANNPISFNDPNGDIIPAILAAIAVGGGLLNVASNLNNIGSFTEGLNYFAVGAAGYGVSTVNPIAGGAILAGGNLLTKGVYGDLPQLNSLGDVFSAGTSVGLDFLGPLAVGSSYLNSSFNAAGVLTKPEAALLAKSGIRPSLNAAAGTGVRTTLVETLGKETVKHSSKVLGQNLLKAGIQRPLNSAAHHIVAGGSTNKFAQMSRDIINRAGVGIDDAANGSFLPKNLKYPNPPASIHSKIHTNLYYENVYQRLSNVPLNEVPNQLKYIGNQLLNGTFPY